MQTSDLRERRDEILRIAAKHGAGHVRVFGSVARGEADETSDLDLLVSFGPSSGLFEHVGLIQELEDLLGCHVDVVGDGGLSPYLADRIRSEAVPL